MSVECGECEMDLRGGHAPGCSRYRPEAEVSGYLVREELIHEADVPEVERLVLRVLGTERARLREKVEAMRRNAMSRSREVAFSEVFALLEPEAAPTRSQPDSKAPE